MTQLSELKPSKIEKKAIKWAKQMGITDSKVIEAFISGYSQCEKDYEGKLYTIEEIKEIVN